jgi:hypothetical protein
MIGACKWLIRKCPNALIVLAGLWIAISPGIFLSYVEDRIIDANVIPEGLDALLYRVYSTRYVDEATTAIFFLGMGTACAGIAMMLRPWIRPLLRPPVK